MSQPERVGNSLDIEDRLRRVLGRLGEKFCITVLIQRINPQLQNVPCGIGSILPRLRLVSGIAQGACLEAEYPGAERQCGACGRASKVGLGCVCPGQDLRNGSQFIDDEADHFRPIGTRTAYLRNIGRIDDQRSLVVISSKHRIIKSSQKTRLRLHLGNRFGRKLLVEIDMLKQHVAAAYTGVGILPAAGKDSAVGRVAALGKIVPVERIGVVVSIGRGALLHGDSHAPEHAAIAQRKITAGQPALRIFGTIPESLVAVCTRRLEIHRTRNGSRGEQQAQSEICDLFHFQTFCR